jgi:hypothetical protein
MIQLKNLKLIGLLSLLVNLNSYALSPDKQTQITQMLADFLNPSYEPTKGFEKFIDDLQNLIAAEPEFKRFVPVLAKIRNQKNVNLVKLEIAKNRGNAPQFVRDMLGDITKLSTILAARVAVRS